MQFSCKAHCHLQPFHQSPVTSSYHVCSLWRYGKPGPKEKFFQRWEFSHHLHTLLYFTCFLKSSPFSSFTDEESWSSELKFSRDVCPLLRAACSHHSGPAAPRGACNSLFYSSVSRWGSQATLCKLSPLEFVQPSSTKDFYTSWRYLSLHLKW